MASRGAGAPRREPLPAARPAPVVRHLQDERARHAQRALGLARDVAREQQVDLAERHVEHDRVLVAHAQRAAGAAAAARAPRCGRRPSRRPCPRPPSRARPPPPSSRGVARGARPVAERRRALPTARATRNARSRNGAPPDVVGVGVRDEERVDAVDALAPQLGRHPPLPGVEARVPRAARVDEQAAARRRAQQEAVPLAHVDHRQVQPPVRRSRDPPGDERQVAREQQAEAAPPRRPR